MTIRSQIAANFQTISGRIADACRRAGRNPEDITILGASKNQPVERLQWAWEAGLRVFGENRVQEALSKMPQLPEAIEWHLLGPLQSNKTGDAVALFDVIESVDREKIAREIAKEIKKQERAPRLYVQVNTGEEPQKAGVLPAEVDGFVAECRALDLPVVGLMCIPPVDEEPSMHFALLAKMAERNGLAGLSMGMSGDFEKAISFGATHVRVGSAIFGDRDYS